MALCLSFKISNAQIEPTPLFIKQPVIPSFRLINVADSSIFTKDFLDKRKATILMVFSPDCEHCQQMTKEITANIKKFKKVQIVMTSPLPYDFIKKFYIDYKIAKYPIITLARDPTYFLGNFFKVRSFPSFFIYNKKGELVNWYNGETPLEKIIASY